jgi:exodeoxyribonuclease VII small subunit
MAKKKTLENSLEELEKIVTELESEELPLDDSIKFFEKGVELYKSCKTQLESAEKKIKVLTDDLKEEDY